jgi:hypothetical protein
MEARDSQNLRMRQKPSSEDSSVTHGSVSKAWLFEGVAVLIELIALLQF